MRWSYLGFFTIGIAFIGIGLSTQRSFLYIGLVFLIISLAVFLRKR